MSVPTPGHDAIEAFIASLPEPRRSDMAALHDAIATAVPELRPELSERGSMRGIGYGSYHYRYPTGREGDAPVIALANNKQYISLYVMGAKDDQYVAESYADRLPTANIGKSCVRFRRLDGVDLDVVAQLVRDGLQALRDEPSTTVAESGTGGESG